MIFVEEPCVLVVGAGPVGLTVAAELLRRGVSCRIVDMAEGPSRWAKASVLHARTLELLDDLGLAAEAVRRGRRIGGMGIYQDGRRIGDIRLDGMDTPYPFILSLSQRDTEQLLAGLVERLGGHVERRVRLAGLTQDGAAVTAQLLREDGSAELCRTQWVVGCDGAFSSVRQALDVPFDGQDYGLVVLQADLRVQWPEPMPQDEILAFFSESGPLAAMPMGSAPDGFRVMAFQPQVSDVEPSLANFQSLMDARGPAGTVLHDPEWLVGFPMRRRLAPCYRVGRTFLCGDAAHLQSPVSGQGMNLGLQDAYNLGWKLALVAQGLAAPSLLDSYEEERRPEAADTLDTADELTRVFTTFMMLRGPEAEAARQQVFDNAGRGSPLAQRISRGAGMLTTSYRGSSIVGEFCGWDGPPDESEERSAVVRIAAAQAARAARRAAGNGQHEDGRGAPADQFYDFGAGPAPGDHAADVELRAPYAGHGRLFELLHGTQHTLLLFAGLQEPADAARLSEAAVAVAQEHEELVQSFVVIPGDQRPEGLGPGVAVLLDPGGAMHRRYGATRECLYLIRPDEYVGYRSHPLDAGRLLAHLLGALGTPRPEPAAPPEAAVPAPPARGGLFADDA